MWPVAMTQRQEYPLAHTIEYTLFLKPFNTDKKVFRGQKSIEAGISTEVSKRVRTLNYGFIQGTLYQLIVPNTKSIEIWGNSGIQLRTTFSDFKNCRI